MEGWPVLFLEHNRDIRVTLMTRIFGRWDHQQRCFSMRGGTLLVEGANLVFLGCGAAGCAEIKNK